MTLQPRSSTLISAAQTAAAKIVKHKARTWIRFFRTLFQVLKIIHFDAFSTLQMLIQVSICPITFKALVPILYIHCFLINPIQILQFQRHLMIDFEVGDWMITCLRLKDFAMFSTFNNQEMLP